MKSTSQLAKHFTDFYFGNNWTGANMQSLLEGVTWKEATTQHEDLNTIATLVFHINYYVDHVLQALQGKPFTANDKFSFDTPPIKNEADWEKLKSKIWSDGKTFATAINALDDEQLWLVFQDEKYGNHYRNFLGIIEHGHYHLGQIALIKKLIRKTVV